MPSVSAVITTYRRPETLLRAIRSVIEQRTKPDEIIVVDNAGEREAEDVTVLAAKETTIPLRYVVELRPGASAARNTGIREALGDYVAFLDDDDVWLPSHLAEFKRICAGLDKQPVLFGGWLARYGNVEKLILPTSDRFFRDYERPAGLDFIVRRQGPLLRPFFTPSMSVSVIDRKEAARLLFDEELVGREDIYFVWQLAQRGDVVLHEQIHALADQLDSSLFSVSQSASAEQESTMNMKKALYGVKMLEKCCQSLGEPPPTEMARELSAAFSGFSYVNALSGNFKLAAIYLLKSMRLGLESRHLKLALRVLFSPFVASRRAGSR